MVSAAGNLMIRARYRRWRQSRVDRARPLGEQAPRAKASPLAAGCQPDGDQPRGHPARSQINGESRECGCDRDQAKGLRRSLKNRGGGRSGVACVDRPPLPRPAWTAARVQHLFARISMILPDVAAEGARGIAKRASNGRKQWSAASAMSAIRKRACAFG